MAIYTDKEPSDLIPRIQDANWIWCGSVQRSITFAPAPYLNGDEAFVEFHNNHFWLLLVTNGA